MWGILKTWFAPKVPELPRAPETEVHFYPPWPDSYYLQPPQQLLEPHHGIIRRIKDALALSEEDWQRMFVPVLERLACHVQILPASEPKTEEGHHAFPGGLLHHCLESCYWALHFAHARNPYKHPLKSIDPEESNARFKRWKVGVALAALCHDIGKPITDTRIISVETNDRWRPNHRSMCEWAVATGTRRVRIDWIADRYGRHETVSTVYVERIIGNDFQDWITDSDESIWYDILASISSPAHHQSVMATMANLGDRESTALDKAERKRHEIADHSMEPAAKLLMQLVRSFVNNRKHWEANEKGARVWVTHHGVFITQKGLEEVAEELRRRDYRRLIDDEYAVASTLLDGRYIEAADPEQHRIYWLVYPELLRNADGQPVKLKMVRFIHAHHVFGDYELPAAVAAKVKAPAGEFLPAPASSYLNKRNKGTVAVPDGAIAPAEHNDLSDVHHSTETPPSADASAEESNAPVDSTAGTETALGGVANDLPPGWEHAALAEQLRAIPALFDVLTDPAKAARIVNTDYPPRVFLRLPLLSRALDATPKEVISRLAKEQLIEPLSGLTYPHDIGESVKGLLLNESKFAQFYPFIANVVNLGVDAFDQQSAEAHRQITRTPSSSPLSPDRGPASGFSFMRRQAAPPGRTPSSTEKVAGTSPGEGTNSKGEPGSGTPRTDSAPAKRADSKERLRKKQSDQASFQRTHPSGPSSRAPVARSTQQDASGPPTRRTTGRGKTVNPKLSFAAHVCAKTAQAIDARASSRPRSTEPLVIPFAELKIEAKDTKLIDCLLKRGYVLDLDQAVVICNERDIDG
jgi:hypothetical protein